MSQKGVQQHDVPRNRSFNRISSAHPKLQAISHNPKSSAQFSDGQLKPNTENQQPEKPKMTPEEVEAHEKYIFNLAKPKMMQKLDKMESYDFKPKIGTYQAPKRRAPRPPVSAANSSKMYGEKFSNSEQSSFIDGQQGQDFQKVVSSRVKRPNRLFTGKQRNSTKVLEKKQRDGSLNEPKPEVSLPKAPKFV